jgi:DnaJ-class molecular chaperone
VANMSQETNYYTLLNVEYIDPPQKIRARYWQLARQTHPDSTGNQERVAQFAQYAHAYRVLSDPVQRLQYNQQLGIFVRPRSLAPGYDIHETLIISTNQALQGYTTTLTYRIDEPCERCWRQGCERCEGFGAIIEHTSVELNVPAGTKHGTTLFIEGHGARTEPGGTRGNLLVYIVIKSTATQPQS